MSLVIAKSSLFHNDVTSQFRWYFQEAGEDLAWRFFESVDETLFKLAAQPDLGRKRHFKIQNFKDCGHSGSIVLLTGFLIFYRVTGQTLEVWRLMHGARDLPHRLTEPLV